MTSSAPSESPVAGHACPKCVVIFDGSIESFEFFSILVQTGHLRTFVLAQQQKERAQDRVEKKSGRRKSDSVRGGRDDGDSAGAAENGGGGSGGGSGGGDGDDAKQERLPPTSQIRHLSRPALIAMIRQRPALYRRYIDSVRVATRVEPAWVCRHSAASPVSFLPVVRSTDMTPRVRPPLPPAHGSDGGGGGGRGRHMMRAALLPPLMRSAYTGRRFVFAGGDDDDDDGGENGGDDESDDESASASAPAKKMDANRPGGSSSVGDGGGGGGDGDEEQEAEEDDELTDDERSVAPKKEDAIDRSGPPPLVQLDARKRARGDSVPRNDASANGAVKNGGSEDDDDDDVGDENLESEEDDDDFLRLVGSESPPVAKRVKSEPTPDVATPLPSPPSYLADDPEPFSVAPLSSRTDAPASSDDSDTEDETHVS